MTIKIIETGPDLAQLAEELQKDIRDEMFGAMGDSKERLIRRTKSGHYIDGNPFKAYSKDYAEIKRNGGIFNGQKISATGKNTRIVDLELTGAMFKAIKPDAKLIGNEVIGTLTVADATEAEKVIENEKRGRKFYDLTDEEVEIIRGRVIQAINKN